MTITEVYYEQLLSGGNYDNYRIGLRAKCENGEVEECLRALQKQVAYELAGIKARSELEGEIRLESDHLHRLREEAGQFEERLTRMREWMRNHQPLIAAFQADTSILVDEPVTPF